MLRQNAYKAYNNNKINTASPAELTLMLYEGAIKFCNMALVSIDKNDIQAAHNSLRKAENIVEEFQATLNPKYEVSKDFNQVYEYILGCMHEGNRKKDKALIEEALRHLRTMRDTWKEVMRLNQPSNKTNVS